MIDLKMNSGLLLFVICAAAIIAALSSSSAVTTVVGQSSSGNSSNSTSRDYYYYAGSIADPNDPTHIKAQQQAAQDRWISNVCDGGHGNPLCYDVGLYVCVDMMLSSNI